MSDLLFGHISQLQGERPWGAVLDAGTGRNSLDWLLRLPSTRCTAITGAQGMADQVHASLGARLRADDRLVVGNWSDPTLLAGERYDTVLADYLVGAIEGFAPYTQEAIFERLRPLVAGRLYLVGLEPYVPILDPATEAGQLVCEIGRLRDACLLLAGERPYREFPMDWILHQLERAGYRIIDARRFPIRYRERFIHSQLDMCVRRIERLSDRWLAASLDAHVADLRARAVAQAQADDGLRFGADYVVAAEPISSR